MGLHLSQGDECGYSTLRQVFRGRDLRGCAAPADSERGEFVDPRDGSITVADYATRYWKVGVRGAPGTVKRIDERVRLHVLPHLGEVALRDVSATVLRG